MEDAAASAAEMAEAPKMPASAAWQWRVVDSEETCHFFNAEMMLSTNDTRARGAGEREEKDRDQGELAGSGCASRAIAGSMDATPLPRRQVTYEDVFPSFDDLFLPELAARDDAPILRERRQRQQQRAIQMLGSCCKDVRLAHTYVDRKRMAFLRSCYARAIERERELPKSDPQQSSDQEDSAGACDGHVIQAGKQLHAIEMTRPTILPREWPHLPYRHPHEWQDSVEAFLEFAIRLAKLPEGGLLYEPIDVEGFVREACALLGCDGIEVDPSATHKARTPRVDANLSQNTVVAVTGLMALGVKLQSFSILVFAAELMVEYGASTLLASPALHPGIRDIMQTYCQQLSKFSANDVPAATYSRALVAQWKICSYQPSTSDAIASDGTFLYVYGRAGLFKLGTGNKGTLRDYVYAHNRDYIRSREAERSWLCCIGEYLYCRTIIMPGSRVDRIPTGDINTVEDLFFGPHVSVQGKNVTDSSVYAMVTDGKYLFTIKCIDTHKHSARKKSRSAKPKKMPLRGSSKHSSSQEAVTKGTIRIGDRVVRGPDWKWGSQDGERGSVGTVERINSWGGVKGCGITVRWDKNQRVNTYRWGAEGCFDLIIVIEKDGKIVAGKPLPPKPPQAKEEAEPDLPPRHQFVVFRHDVENVTPILNMDDATIASLLDISSSDDKAATSAEDESEGLLSALHSHVLSLSDSPTSWMCDGGTSGCLGDDSGKRYRCESGCDYDLCEVCLRTTLIAKKSTLSLADVLAGVDAVAVQLLSERLDRAEETSEKHSPESRSTPKESESKESDDALASSAPVLDHEDVSDDDRADILLSFWNGMFSKKECQIALRRCNQSLKDASSWLNSSVDSLRRKNIVPTIGAVMLTAPPSAGALDPVLLIAGSFYAAHNQLCIVSPPGICQSEHTKRSLHASDTAWFFSLSDGTLFGGSDAPVLLKGVPAGSPMCVDHVRDRILVFSGFLNCIEEYAISTSCQTTSREANLVFGDDVTVRSVGTTVFQQIHRIMQKRFALPALQHRLAGLQDILFRTESESVTSPSVKPPGTTGSIVKTRSRRIKNIRLRLRELEKLGHVDRCGYVVPFCTDFHERGLFTLMQRVCSGVERIDLSLHSLSMLQSLRDAISMLAATARDFTATQIRIICSGERNALLEAAGQTLSSLAVGSAWKWDSSYEEQMGSILFDIVCAAQTALLWGASAGMFRKLDRFSILRALLEQIVQQSQLSTRYFELMTDDSRSRSVGSSVDCATIMLRRILATRNGFADLVNVESEAVELTDLLFKLAVLEFKAGNVFARPSSSVTALAFSPVGNALHSLLNCVAVAVIDETGVSRGQDQPETSFSLFEHFALACICACDKLIRESSEAERCLDDHRLPDSIICRMLPMVLAVVCIAAHRLSHRIRDSLVSLAQTIERLAPPGEQDFDHCGVMDAVHVIESTHPYSRSQSALRRVIHIPGASCIHIEFDPRCSTIGEADFVFVAPGRAWIQTDRTPFGDTGIGDNGGCFFGHASKGNWPRAGLTVVGDTVTIKLCATGQARDDGQNDELRRWGVKCSARGIRLRGKNWLRDLRWSIAHACSRIAESLVAHCTLVPARSIELISHFDWMKTASGVSAKTLELASAIAEGGSRGDQVAAQFDCFSNKNRAHIPASSLSCWMRALHHVLAVLTISSRGFKEDSTFRLHKSAREHIAIALVQVEQRMVMRVQSMKEWHFLCTEGTTLEELTERYDGDKDRLQELCLLNGVDTDTRDIQSVINTLFNICSASANNPCELTQSHHELVAAEICQKAQLALERLGSMTRVKNDAVSSGGESRSLRGVTKYLTSNARSAELRQLVAIHSENAGRLGEAVHLLHQGFVAMARSDTAAFFVTALAGLMSEASRICLSTPLASTDAIRRCKEWATDLASIAGDSARPWKLRVAAIGAFCSLATICDSQLLLQQGEESAAELLRSFNTRTGIDQTTSQVWHPTCDMAWAAYRIIAIPICMDTPSREWSERIAATLVGLFRQSVKQDGLSFHAGSPPLGYRILCVLASCPQLLKHQDSARCWWQECFSLITSSSPVIASSVLVAAIRVLRRIFSIHGSLCFESVDDAKSVPSDQVMLLVERAGQLMSDLQATVVSIPSDTQDCCCVVYDSDVARTSINKAIEKVGAPDPSVWKVALNTASLPVQNAPVTIDPTAEETSSVVHRSVRCDGCNQSPLHGIRFKCFVCTNYDLCAKCYLGQTHSSDHQFVHISDPSESGQLLQPRSKGGGVVPEMSLVGSDDWKGGLFCDHLSTFGYAVYRRGKSHDCIVLAEALSELGFATTVMTWDRLTRLDSAYDWESQVEFAFEPGSRRSSRRSSSTPTATTGRVDRSLVASCNHRAASLCRKQSSDVSETMVDTYSVVSELVSMLRVLLDGAIISSSWKEVLVRCLADAIEQTPRLFGEDSRCLSLQPQYCRSIGAAYVLGGFREILRVGAHVLLRDPNANQTRHGVLVRFGIGNEDVVAGVKSASEPDQVRFVECVTADLVPIASREVDAGVVQQLECLVPTFCTLVSVAQGWIGSKDESSDEWMLATELIVAWMRAFSMLMPQLPMLLDNQVISIHGNAPMWLFQLAGACSPGSSLERIEEIRHVWWQMQRMYACSQQYSYATRPLPHDRFAGEESDVLRPNASGGASSEFADAVFNMYAHSSRYELPQHSGRNKLLEYWEKNVIPAIQLYVAGSFKSYEMDYFFAQLREPLREGNAATAMKIAFTLCDGHIPAGCHYPEPDTDWTSLQIDDVEVGSRYVVCSQGDDIGDWPAEMVWTIGQSGVARIVNPSGMVLLQLINPMTSLLEEWWFHVDNLLVSRETLVPSDHTVKEFAEAKSTLLQMNLQLISAMARKCVFELLSMAPEQFSLAQKTSESREYFSLVQLLRMAASAELGCQENAILGEHLPNHAYNQQDSNVHGLLSALRVVLSKQFDHIPVHFRRLEQQKASQIKSVMITKTSKSGASGATKVATTMLELDSNSILTKYRTELMETLVNELKRCLDASAQFLQRNTMVVASESPPRPLVMVHVPNASSLVFSFAVHPVLMDLPAGSSLEIYRDQRCMDRVFGYFGEKRGLNYLPSMVVPGEKCFIKMSQGSYARYKFRVDPITSDFGLAMWIADEIYQKLVAIPFSLIEQETILASVLDAMATYAVDVALPPSVKSVVFQVLSKLINFAFGRAMLKAVPITKLSAVARELVAAHDTELSMQKGLFSSFTQQLSELLSLVEEVSRLKGASSPIIDAGWWGEFARLASFTRVLSPQKDAVVSDGAFKRIFCGRAPMQEVENAWKTMVSRDLLCERMILIQKLPKTNQIDELKAALSRFVVRVCMEACGESDDQTVLSAAEVVRFGILARVLFLPVDAEGFSLGYAVVDVGREDIISTALSRMQAEKFDFDAEGTPEDGSLLERIAAICKKTNGASTDQSKPDGSAAEEEQMWACMVCTLANPMEEIECTACGSPMPPEVDERRTRSAPTEGQQATEPTAAESASSEGWPCAACTLVNPWSETECMACASPRDPDLVPPASNSSPEPAEETTPVSADQARAHQLSGVRLVEALHVAEEDEVSQVNAFLRSIFIPAELSTADQAPGTVQLSPSLVGSIQKYLARYEVSRSSKRAIDELSNALGTKWSITGRRDADAMEDVISAVQCAAQERPFALYRWLRVTGLDLEFESSHYPDLQDACAAEGKWTHQMDSQLIAMSRNVCSTIGVLALVELCPTHLTAAIAKDYSLLAQLETRDLRLRFFVVRTMNSLLASALPLVNLKWSSDAMSLRSRIMSTRQFIFPGVKIRFFAQTQDNANIAAANMGDVSIKRPTVTLDRRRIISRRSPNKPLALDNPEISLFASTMAQLSNTKPSVLRAKRPTGASDPFVSFVVIFTGEHVVGEGGPYRQLFNDIANELLSPDTPLFVPTQNNVLKIGEYRERYLPRPSSVSKDHLKMFEFVGVLMGCSLRTGVRLNLRLAPIIWKMLVKQSLTHVDLEHVDWSICESFKYFEAAASDSVADDAEPLHDSFTVLRSDGTLLELKPGGMNLPVTRANCKEYIRLAKHARLHECRVQVDAMLRGIGKIVPKDLLQLCTWSELQQWVCGSLSIDIDLLKRHTRYSSGMTPEKFPHLDLFWRVLGSFSEENKRRFVNFAWGQDSLPADDAEFDRTHTRLLIKASAAPDADQDSLLPKADTCFFNIELPAYSSEEIMRKKLLLAITMCTSMDGDDQAGRLDLYYGESLEMDPME